MRLSDEQLARRKNWEECAPNAYQQPDQHVLAMIEEIQERRAAERRGEICPLGRL